ncbi:MAG: rRNA maturation RNase YbeY [Candidatus Tenebribacter burtonii]|nr:rRNA maturation RNase YbeY [Candidatus Tenebribacter burtonii]
MNIPKIKSVVLSNKTAEIIEKEIFEELFLIVLNNESRPPDSFVNLELTNDGSIKQLNKKYLGRDEITDVLSFIADIPGINLIGDIIIDTNVAKSQKEDRMISEELQILFLHGLLHCLGYDHLSIKEKKIMDAKEKKYINLLNKEKS